MTTSIHTTLSTVNISTQLTWWRHQMEKFPALLAICAGNSFPAQRPVTLSFDVHFDLRPNKRLSKQWRGWWFETQSGSLWRHRNVWPSARTGPPPKLWVVKSLAVKKTYPCKVGTDQVLWGRVWGSDWASETISRGQIRQWALFQQWN